MAKLAGIGLLLLTLLGAATAAAQISGGIEKAAVGEALPVSSSLGLWVAQVKVMKGHAAVERDGRRLTVAVGMRLKQADVLTTSTGGAVGVTFNDNSTLAIGSNTQIVIQHFAFDTTTHQGYFDTRVQRGTVAVQTGQIARQSPDAMRVITRTAELRGHAAAYVVSVSGENHE